MQHIDIRPIGRVVSEISDSREDQWGNIAAEVQLDGDRFAPEALAGLEDFSHVEILFLLDQIPENKIENKQRHPRNNPNFPKVGIFAQRGKNRPNRIGTTICEVVSVNDLTLKVRGLDAFDGTPVLDIKPVMAEFLPDRNIVRQPRWARELMSTYF